MIVRSVATASTRAARRVLGSAATKRDCSTRWGNIPAVCWLRPTHAILDLIVFNTNAILLSHEEITELGGRAEFNPCKEAETTMTS